MTDYNGCTDCKGGFIGYTGKSYFLSAANLAVKKINRKGRNGQFHTIHAT